MILLSHTVLTNLAFDGVQLVNLHFFLSMLQGSIAKGEHLLDLGPAFLLIIWCLYIYSYYHCLL